MVKQEGLIVDFITAPARQKKPLPALPGPKTVNCLMLGENIPLEPQRHLWPELCYVQLQVTNVICFEENSSKVELLKAGDSC